MKIIEIIVTPEGSTRVETKGFAGAECREASRFLENALGRRSQEEISIEFHAASSTELHRMEEA